MSIALEDRPQATASLPVDNPAQWPSLGWEKTLQLSWKDYAPIQLEAMQRRFEQLRGKVAALERLADRQGVDDDRQLRGCAAAVLRSPRLQELSAER